MTMLKLAAILPFLLSLSLPVPAESEESGGSRADLARELFEVSGGEARVKQTLNTVLGQFSASYDQFYKDLAASIEFSSPEERDQFLARSASESEEFFASFDLLDRIDYYQTAIDALVPIYAEMYTEQELGKILAFYRSPVGQKMINTQPARLQQATQALFAELLPAIQAELAAAFEAERARLIAATQ